MSETHDEPDPIDPRDCPHPRLEKRHAYGHGHQAVYDWTCVACGYVTERSGYEGEE